MSITDHSFARLGLKTKLIFAEDELQNAYRVAAALAHPDAGGSTEIFNQIHQAHAILASPSKRLIHWLELHGITFDSRGTLNNSLMNLFCEIGTITQTAEAIIKRRDTAQSALVRALMEREIQNCREQLTDVISAVQYGIQLECNSFSNFETTFPIPHESACRCARNLTFLEKWQNNLKSLFSRLA